MPTSPLIPPPRARVQLAPLADALVRSGAGSHVAGLLEIAGAGAEARQVRRAAWESGDVGARVGEALADLLDDPAHGAAGIEALIADAGHGVESGRLEETRGARALTALWAFLCGTLHNVSLAESVLFARESLAPGRSLPSLGGQMSGVGARSTLAALVSIMEALQNTRSSVAQGGLLLRLHVIAAGVPVPEFRNSRSMIDMATEGGGGALLSLVLHRIDRASADPQASLGSDVTNYLEFLAGRPSDETERAAFQLRRVLLESSRGDLTHAYETLRATESRVAALPWGIAAREAIYVNALRLRDPATAARIAIDRAERTRDTSLAVAWGVRGLLLLRESEPPADVMREVCERLLHWVSQHRTALPAVEALAQDCLAGALIHGRRWKELKAALARGRRTDESEWLEACLALDEGLGPDPEALDRLLTLETEFADLIPVIASRVGEPGKCADLLGARAMRVADGGTASRLRELRVFLALFQAGRGAEASREAEALVTRELPSLPALWALWFAEAEAGKLDGFIDRARRLLAEASGPTAQHLHASIAEAHFVRGDGDAAVGHLDSIEDADWREAILRRQRRSTPELTVSGTWGAVAEMRDVFVSEPRLRAGLDAGRDLLRKRRWREATAAFSQLASLARRREDQYQLLIVAGRSANLADPGGDGAELLYLRAAEMLPEAADAWARLVKLYLAHKKPERVAEVCRGRTPRFAEPAVRAALRNAARELRARGSDGAREIERVLTSTLDLLSTAGEADDEIAQIVRHAHEDGYPDQVAGWLHAMLERAGGASAEGPIRHALARLLAGEQERDRDPAQSGTDVERLAGRVRSEGYRPEEIDRLDEALQASGQRSAAAATFEQIAEGATGAVRGELFWRAARHWEAAGELERAIAAARSAIAAAPRHAEAQLRMGEYHRARADWEQAASHLEQGARLVMDPERRATLYQSLGELYETHLDRRSLALESYLVAFICQTDNPVVFDRLQSLYESMGRYRDLLGSYEIAIDHARAANGSSSLDLEDLLVRRARIEFQHLNDPERAAASLIDALRLNPAAREYVEILMKTVASRVPAETMKTAIDLHLGALSEEDAQAARGDPAWARFLSSGAPPG